MNDSPEDQLQDIAQLGVPLSLQNDGYSCVPHCLKMVLEYLHRTHPEILVLPIEEIIRAIGTTELGTEYGSIENINKLLEKSIPSVDFKRDASSRDWKSVQKDLQEGKPVILWIKCRDQLGHPYNHSVVVDGYINKKVLYKDPLYGDMEEGIDTFLSKWDEMDRYTIRVKVGERTERKITEYLP